MQESSVLHLVLLLRLLIVDRAAAGACNPSKYEPVLESSLHTSHGNGSAAADAFLQACDGQRWSSFDVKKYLQNNWHAGAPAGASCSKLRRIGLYGDGGKAVCKIDQLLASEPCRVVSVGSNGEPSFERAIHTIAPHCRIDTFDGTLVGGRQQLRDNLPAYVQFYPENVDSETWRRYSNASHGGRLNLLKMDWYCLSPRTRGSTHRCSFPRLPLCVCSGSEGCEFEALPPLVQNVCIDQLLLEVHGCEDKRQPKTSKPFGRLMRVHQLMKQLDGLYRIFHSEPNVVYSDGTCVEYSFIRRVPCMRSEKRERASPVTTASTSAKKRGEGRSGRSRSWASRWLGG